MIMCNRIIVGDAVTSKQCFDVVTGQSGADCAFHVTAYFNLLHYVIFCKAVMICMKICKLTSNY